MAATIAETEIVGPPQAVNASLVSRAVDIPGSFTDIELTTGQDCSPSTGTSLDCTRKPTSGLPVAGSVSSEGATEKTDSCPSCCTVVESGPVFPPCMAPIRVTVGRPSREHGVPETFATSTGL